VVLVKGSRGVHLEQAIEIVKSGESWIKGSSS
jgi:hypothetical protein